MHCLAGAHRAGTTGVSFMMREGRFGADTAIRLAKAAARHRPLRLAARVVEGARKRLRGVWPGRAVADELGA